VSYTKGDFVKAALAEIGIANYAFDLTTDQLDQALARLDVMMGEWNGRGIRLGYPIASDLKAIESNAESNVPDWASEAVITNLAIRLAPAYGKTVSVDTRTTAVRGMNTLFARAVKPKPARLGPMLAGAGAKQTQPFIAVQSDVDRVDNPDESVDFQ
jgi:hypothetical protein